MNNWLALDGDLMVEEREYVNVQDKAILRLKQNPKFLLDTVNLAYKLNEEIVTFAKAVNDKVSDGQIEKTLLIELFDKYVGLSLKASAFMLFPMFLESYLENSIREEVIRIFDKNEVEKIMQVLTTSVRTSATLEEEINVLEIAVKKENPSVEEHEKLVSDFGWLKNNLMDGNFYSSDDYLRRIQDLKKDNPKKKLSEIITNQQKHLKQAVEYKKALGSDTAVLVDTLSEAIFFRSWRTERMYRNVQYLQNFLTVTAGLIGLKDVNDIFLLTPNEVSSLLEENKPANVEMINERKSGFVLFADNKNTTIYSGEILTEAKNGIVFLEQNNSKEIKGQTAFPGKATGKVLLILSKDDFNKFRSGHILVSHSTTPDYVPIMKESLAIITDEGGILSHASVISRELKIPCIIGTKNATQVLKDGDLVEVDAEKGVVKIYLING